MKAWLLTPDEKTLDLPPGNGYVRRMCYVELSKHQFGVEGSPGFYVIKVGYWLYSF